MVKLLLDLPKQSSLLNCLSKQVSIEPEGGSAQLKLPHISILECINSKHLLPDPTLNL